MCTLHRLDLSLPGTRDNEILTDTAAAYLGAGWLLLDAYREHGPFSQKLGYLTPEEFGYVLAQRAAVLRRGPGAVVHQPAGVRRVHGGRGAGPPGRAPATARRRRLGRPAALRQGPPGGTGSAPRRPAARHRRLRLRGPAALAGVVPLPRLPPADPRPGPRPAPGTLRAVQDAAGLRYVTRRQPIPALGARWPADRP